MIKKRPIPIEIPTTKYVKAYIQHRLGKEPIINTRSNIGSKLYDLLNHVETDGNKVENTRYNAVMKLYIPHRTFYHRGAFISHQTIRDFNSYLSQEVKREFRTYMDWYVSTNASFIRSLPAVRQKIGITDDDWETESIKKDYYRYRLNAGLPLLYVKA